ncbi:hypothetical protein [Pimelobacter sp. 30-1]|uniref:hypothetical protein n=1 Tax=Pimelobacter TaxID=2044 RepID=UPI001C0567EE|nr:hypothetical protein [Pimelobacter sp. 30-1]MBU2695404.1 hypothetical protein [Pimelobacter sp. 30-1]
MSTTAPASARLSGRAEVRLGLGGACQAVGAAVCVAVPLAGWYGVAALLALTTAWCVVLPRRLALVLALAGWAWATGFAVNTLGELTFAPADLARLAAYLAIGAWAARAQ